MMLFDRVVSCFCALRAQEQETEKVSAAQLIKANALLSGVREKGPAQQCGRGLVKSSYVRPRLALRPSPYPTAPEYTRSVP